MRYEWKWEKREPRLRGPGGGEGPGLGRRGSHPYQHRGCGTAWEIRELRCFENDDENDDEDAASRAHGGYGARRVCILEVQGHA